MHSSRSEAVARILRKADAADDLAPVLASLEGLIGRMERFDGRRNGPVREVMARLGDRWSTLLLMVLSAGSFRHATLRRLVGVLSAEQAISQRMLTLRLRALERDGFVARTVTDSVPPRVDYALTPLGRDFVVMIDGLLRWIETHSDAIRESRRAFEAAEKP